MKHALLLTGFTLIELLVVLSIIVLMTAMVLNSQSSFNKTLILANTAYDVALTLRSAETFAVVTGAPVANAGYGVHLDRGTTNSFILFADTTATGGASCAGQKPDCKPGDGVYTPGADVLVQKYTLGNGITIKDFCAGAPCTNGSLSTLDIVFARPNPTPVIHGDGAAYTSACLTIASPSAPGGPYRYVTVGSTGAITANATLCP